MKKFIADIEHSNGCIDQYEGVALNAQEFHKKIFFGEFMGQYEEKPESVIKEIRDENGVVVFNNNIGFKR